MRLQPGRFDVAVGRTRNTNEIPMSDRIISCAWWHQHEPTPAPTPLDALRITADHLERGAAVPDLAANIVARAFRQYLEGQTDITKNLGLRPRRGGRNETPMALERRRARDSLIVQVYELQVGCKTERAGKVVALLRVRPGAARVTEEEVFAYLLDLHREHGGNLPTSMRQVLRVVEDCRTTKGRR